MQLGHSSAEKTKDDEEAAGEETSIIPASTGKGQGSEKPKGINKSGNDDADDPSADVFVADVLEWIVPGNRSKAKSIVMGCLLLSLLLGLWAMGVFALPSNDNLVKASAPLLKASRGRAALKPRPALNAISAQETSQAEDEVNYGNSQDSDADSGQDWNEETEAAKDEVNYGNSQDSAADSGQDWNEETEAAKDPGQTGDKYGEAGDGDSGEER